MCCFHCLQCNKTHDMVDMNFSIQECDTQICNKNCHVWKPRILYFGINKIYPLTLINGCLCSNYNVMISDNHRKEFHQFCCRSLSVNLSLQDASSPIKSPTIFRTKKTNEFFELFERKKEDDLIRLKVVSLQMRFLMLNVLLLVK